VPDRSAPLTIAVAHSKGGVGKTTTAVIVGKYLARNHRVALKDYDVSRHLTQLVARVAPDGRSLTRKLWLDTDTGAGGAEIVVIDAEPARGPATRQALVEADYVLIPAPPEFMAVTAMEQMLATVDEIRSTANPYLTVLGVVPTMFTRTWPEHRAFLEQMRDVCAAHGVHLFDPIPRRQSYLYLSTGGQDYLPVAEEIERVLRREQEHAA
jgi:cellulose biosynthesis protein BcsQ